MLKCSFVSNGLLDNLEELKVAALYYDKINLLDNIVYSVENKAKGNDNNLVIENVYHCLENELIQEIEPLIKEGIIEIEISTEVRFVPAEPIEFEKFVQPSEVERSLFRRSQEIINKQGNKLWSIIDEKGQQKIVISDEVKRVHSTFLNELVPGSTLNLRFIEDYYSNLLFHILKFASEGKNVINTSSIIDKYFNDFYSQDIKPNTAEFEKLGKPELGSKAIKYFVPDVTTLNFYEILELRQKLKDELENYRFYVSELNESIVNDDRGIVPSDSIQFYLERKINPAIKDLANKISKSKLIVADRFISEIKEPKSYTPIVGSVFANIPAQISLLLSLGIISISTLLKWRQERLEFKNNGLYYLLRLRDKSRDRFKI